MGTNPNRIVADHPMSWVQIAAIAVTVALNALDGFDVLSISFASPGIVKEWGIDRAALGAVLSMELIGMAVGSLLLGRVADQIGRRMTILGCLTVMSVGMTMAATSNNVAELSVWRVLTGLGIGGMLAAINAVAAEFANDRRRGLCMSLMVIGYPVGAVVGGVISANAMKGGDWRAVFEIGALATVICIPLVLAFVPETPAFLLERTGPKALKRVNSLLTRMGRPNIDALPAPVEGPRRALADIFKRDMILTTVLVTVAYFAHIVAFYFILKWIPKIVVDMGFAPASAAGVLVWANVGGAIGGAVFGLLTQKVGLRPLTLAALMLSAAMLAVFGRGQADLSQLALIAGLTGFFTNSAVVGLYALFADVFPTHARATGTGFAIGVGRGGAAMAPFLAGVLFQAGLGLQIVAIIMGCGSLIAAAAVALTPRRRPA